MESLRPDRDQRPWQGFGDVDAFAHVSTPEIIQAMKDMIVPIDFEDLTRRLILRQLSPQRYEVLNEDALPSYVERQAVASEVRWMPDGGRLTILKFRRGSPTESQKRHYRRILKGLGEI
jgi:hypothetical protein